MEVARHKIEKKRLLQLGAGLFLQQLQQPDGRGHKLAASNATKPISGIVQAR